MVDEAEKMKDHGLNCLPQEIKLDISSRLPVESVLNCRLICRAWRDLLPLHDNTNHFANLHLRQHLIKQQDGGSDSSTMSFVVMNSVKPRSLYHLKYHDQGENISDMKHSFVIRKINSKFTTNVLRFVGSSNGLICLSLKTIYKYQCSDMCIRKRNFEQPLFICNPITRESVILPKLCIDQQEVANTARIVYGFGYNPLTNEYKVVTIRYVGDQNNPLFKGLVEVYTLGSGRGWRSKGETNYTWPSDAYSGGNSKYAMGVCVDGALHWLPEGSTEILVFDLAEEEFHLLPTAPSSGWFNFPRRVCFLRRCLCLVYGYAGVYDESFGIWFLKNNMVENGSSRYNWKEKDYKYPCWIRGNDSLHFGRRLNGSFDLTKRDEVLCASDGVIYCYNLKAKTSQQIWTLPKVSPSSLNWALPISHIDSFVSLKALGESNVQYL